MLRSIATLALVLPPLGAQSYVNFESPRVRGLAISADGQRLFALNTPDQRLAVFSLLAPERPVRIDEIPLSLEPVAVRPRTADEVWVTSWLGDAVQVVSLSRRAVIDTIQVGDEPCDIAFAGDRAFVSCATSREVVVLDTASRTVVGRIPIFSDEPRALIATPNGRTVYLAALRSGNGTTLVAKEDAPPPPPPTNPSLPDPPQVSMIVDAADPAWQPVHGVTLPDHDVVSIDVATLSIRRTWSGVGTTLFDLALRQGELWVANTEALNRIDFEPELRGHFIDSRVTRIDATGVTPFDLNPSIDYGQLPNPNAVETALSQPTGVTFDPAGATCWVAAFGSDRIGRVDPATGQVTGFVELQPGVDPRQKRGPRTLAHHPSRPLLYCLNTIAHTVSVIDTGTLTPRVEVSIGPNPESAAIREGRGFLYDAELSGNGTASCAACHIDSRIDGLAWNLGDRGGEMVTVSGTSGRLFEVHPMKGPMTTQTLVGLKGLEPFHWRGDRPRFQDFNGAFDSLMGGSELSSADMDAYTAYIDTLTFPGNPHQNLDRTYSNEPVGESAAEGFDFYVNTPQGIPRCVTCHSLFTGSNADIMIPGAEANQAFKVPQLRNIYRRNRVDGPLGKTGGFGLTHDGAEDDVFDFLNKPVFRALASDPGRRRQLEAFVDAFDTGTAPTVGYSITMTPQNAASPDVVDWFTLMRSRAAAGDIDLVALGRVDGRAVSLLWSSANRAFDRDTAGSTPWSATQLQSLVAGAGDAAVTMMGVPPGTGRRVALDRDEDGILNGDDNVLPYGAASPACDQRTLHANGEPSIGNAEFALIAPDAGSAAALLLGPARASIALLGVTVLVDPDGAVSADLLIDPRGDGLIELPIPSDPALVGQSLFAQVFGLTTCTPFLLSATHGLELRFGN